MIQRPPRSTLCPYTPLFRSWLEARGDSMTGARIEEGDLLLVEENEDPPNGTVVVALLHGERSEEHTSELQSRQYLVCRLLLEKKTSHTLSAYRTTGHRLRLP